MSDMKQSFFTRVLNPIKDNKYFNAKDAMFVGTTAAGAAAGYGLSDGSMDHTINGGIFGAAGGLIHRQGLSGFAKGVSKGIRSVGGVEGEFDSLTNHVIDTMPLGMGKMFKMDSAKDGAIFGAAMIGVGGAVGALGGWAGGQAGAGTTATGGLVEGAALGILAPAIMAKTALSGGGMARQISNLAVGKVAGIAGAVAGGYEGFQGEDGGFTKALVKGAVWGKLATSASMLGMERYGKGFSEKIANSSIGKRLAGV